MDTSVDVPVNVTATVALPVVDGGRCTVSGGRAAYLGVRDGRAVYRVGSGHTAFGSAGRG